MMNSDDCALSFSSNAEIARAYMLARSDKVNIIVEDRGKEYLYQDIFARLIEDDFEKINVIAAGCKNNVHKFYEQVGLYDKLGKMYIYIVDGDFDILWNNLDDTPDNYIYLRRYNIENYYCTRHELLGALRWLLHKTDEEFNNQLKFEEWRDNFLVNNKKLFVLLAINQKLNLGLDGVGKARTLFLDEYGNFNLEEYGKYIGKINSKVPLLDKKIEEVLALISEKMSGDEKEKIMSIICGKYQIKAIRLYCDRLFDIRINKNDFEEKLIQHMKLSPLKYLKDKVLFYIQEKENIKN